MNKDKYKDLCERVEGKVIDAWYRKSEPVFLSEGISCEDDLTKLVAYAYSWMPTIPKWRRDLDWSACEKALNQLKYSKEGALKNVLELIVPSINNSIVGATKALHFAYPDVVPIVDSNVVIGWRALFYPKGVRGKFNEEIAALPSNFGVYGSNEVERSKHINLYVKYSKNILAWSEHLGGVSTRNIETNIYLLGKLIADEVKQANDKN